MNLAFSIIAGILLVIGFIGTFAPVLPGAPLAWVGILFAYFSSYNEVSMTVLIITFITAVVVSILDNFLPVIMTKKFGGSKTAVTGSTVGLMIGFFTGPWGIILGPFIGALIGEFINKKGNTDGVLKAAFGAFVGFITGTGLKMIVVLVFVWIYIISF